MQIQKMLQTSFTWRMTSKIRDTGLNWRYKISGSTCVVHVWKNNASQTMDMWLSGLVRGNFHKRPIAEFKKTFYENTYSTIADNWLHSWYHITTYWYTCVHCVSIHYKSIALHFTKIVQGWTTTSIEKCTLLENRNSRFYSINCCAAVLLIKDK